MRMSIWHWILIIVGLLLLVAAIVSGVNSYKWLSQAKTTEGKVVELIESRGKKNKITYKPRIEYVVDGQLREYTSNTSSNPPDYNIGDPVAMAYSDAHNKATIATFGYIYGFPVIGGMIAIVILTSVTLLINGSKILHWLHPNLG